MGFANIFIGIILGGMTFTLPLLAVNPFLTWQWPHYFAILFALTVTFTLVSAILSYMFESKKKQFLIAHHLAALDNQDFLKRKIMII